MKQYLRLMRYALPYCARIIASVACLFVASLLNAVSIASLQPAFDGLFGGGTKRQMLSLPPTLQAWLGPSLDAVEAFMRANQMSVLTFLAWSLLAVLIVKALVNYVSVILMRYATERIMTDVRDVMYAHLHQLSLGFFMRHNTVDFG